MTTRLPRTINDLGAGATTVAELVGPLPTGYVSSSSDDEGMPIDARAADDPFGMLDYDADIPESASATTTTTTWARELGSLGLKDHGEDILLSGEAPPTTPDPIRNDNASTLSLDALEANGIARPAATPRVCSFPGCECDKSAKIDWRQPMLCNHWFCKNTVARARKLGACPFHGCGRPAKPIQTQTKKGSDQEGSATATTSPSQSSVKPKPNPSDAVASALGLKRKSGAGDETEIPKRQRKQAAPIPAPTTVEQPSVIASPQENMAAPLKKATRQRSQRPIPVAMEGVTTTPAIAPIVIPAPAVAPAPVTTPTPPLTPLMGGQIKLVAIPGAPVIKSGTCLICKTHLHGPFVIHDHMTDHHRFPEPTVRDWLSFPKEHSLPRCTHTDNHYVCFCGIQQPTLQQLYAHLESITTGHGLTKVYRFVFDDETTVFVPDM